MRKQLLAECAPYLLRDAPLQNNASPVRVLYIEDEKVVQVAISQMLEILGYEVACADNGKLGLEKAKSWQPDIIFMDIRMPVMDGLEATRRLRQEPGTAHIPIFILSAYTDAKTREAGVQVGANGLLAKPTSIQKLHAVIQQALRLR